MNQLSRILTLGLLAFFSCHLVHAEQSLVYEGTNGPGIGKHIVFIAGDHEYRSEEALPAVARILAKHHGFKCTVLFTVDAKTGEIVPGNNNIPGLEALESADLMVNFLRFQNLPDEQMQHFVDYLDRAGPVVGLRTSSHAFKIPDEGTFAKYSYQSEEEGYVGGFGRQVLGETWVGHYGKNRVMSTRLDLAPDQKDHPILRGVSSAWVEAGGYWADPMPGSTVLAMAQPLDGMTPDSEPAADKKPCPGVWLRTYKGMQAEGRVFTALYGASVDLQNEGFRRILVNGCYWAMGMEDGIKADSTVDLVGPYHPAPYRNGGHRIGVKPSDLAGFDSPIMSTERPIAKRKPKGKKPSKAKE
ncbi:MAG: ThuA domain-containing protein [Planctomycetota bacterium]